MVFTVLCLRMTHYILRNNESAWYINNDRSDNQADRIQMEDKRDFCMRIELTSRTPGALFAAHLLPRDLGFAMSSIYG